MISIHVRALVLTLILAGLLAQPAVAARPAPLLVQTIDPGARGRTLPREFTGLSYGYQAVNHHAIGNTVTGVNPAFVNLLGAITRTGNGAPVLRISGPAADYSWWNPQGRRKPAGIFFDITPAYVASLTAAQRATGSRLILGLNLAASDSALARDWAAAALEGVGRDAIAAFELGNLPDLYPNTTSGGRRLRPAGWGLPHYLDEFARFAAALEPLGVEGKLAAPGACCRPAWDRGLATLLERHHRLVGTASYHRYGLVACGAQRGRASALLSADTLRGAFFKFLGLARVARGRDRPVRVTSTNSNPCGNRADGLSGTFAPALWSVDWMFTLASAGVSGVNFDTTGRLAPFRSRYDNGAFRTTVHPLYYGMLLFARATAHRARLIAPRPRSVRRRRGARISTWATVDRRGTLRVVLVRKESRGATGRVQVRVPGARRSATLTRLKARRLRSTDGVTLGGQVADPTTGNLSGRRRQARVRPRGGVYTFTIGRASAVMLSLRRAPGARRR
jgi:hypothetical protein